MAVYSTRTEIQELVGKLVQLASSSDLTSLTYARHVKPNVFLAMTLRRSAAPATGVLWITTITTLLTSA